MRIIQLLNRDVVLKDETCSMLHDYIAGYLNKRENKRESITHFVSEIRWYTKFPFPTRQYDAEKMFEGLGFKLERDRNERGSILRTYVTI